MTIAWAAGLFEGEGSIFAGKERGSITLALSMTDEDVVRRFHEVIGRGTVVGPHHRSGQKDQWTWRCSTLDAEVILQALIPWLGVRRTERAEEALQARREYIAWAVRPRECETCGETFVPEYTKRAQRRRYCSQKCKWSAENWRRRGEPSRH